MAFSASSSRRNRGDTEPRVRRSAITCRSPSSSASAAARRSAAREAPGALDAVEVDDDEEEVEEEEEAEEEELLTAVEPLRNSFLTASSSMPSESASASS